MKYNFCDEEEIELSKEQERFMDGWIAINFGFAIEEIILHSDLNFQKKLKNYLEDGLKLLQQENKK